MSYYNAAAAWPCWGRGDRQRGRAQGSGTRRPSMALPAALRAEAWAEGCSLTEAGFVLAFDQLLLPRDVGGPSLAPLMACHGQRSHMGGAARYWGRAPGAALRPAGPPLPGRAPCSGPWASLYCYLWCKREGCAGRCAGWPRGPKGPPGLLANAVWTQLRPRREEAQASILHREREEGPPAPPSPGAPVSPFVLPASRRGG